MRVVFGLLIVIVLAFGGGAYYVFFSTKTINGLTGPAVDLFIDFSVLGETPLNGEGIAPLAGRTMRTRYWTIPSGSIVPVHEHANRPATIYTLQGSIFEHRNDRDEPVLHEAGGLSLEEGSMLAHWWRNAGDQEVRLVAFDIYQSADDVTSPGPVAATPNLPELSAMPDAAGATRELLGFVDLSAHFLGSYGEGYALTTYRVTLQPGGVLPFFTEGGEPVHVFLEDGSVTETRPAGATTVLSPRGFSRVDGGAAAWWENTGPTPARLIIGALERTDGLDLAGGPDDE
ncbi:MAG: hypothetical protein ACFB6R_14980 [Alphaproteobacteria bacterium]